MNMCALVVEPDPDRGQRVARLCEQAELEPTHCLDGESALMAKPGASFELLVTQLSLPNMDPFEFIARVKRRPRMQNVRVVAMSAFGELLTTARTLRGTVGIDVVLSSAVAEVSLVRALKTLVSGASAQVGHLRELEPVASSPAAEPDSRVEHDRQNAIDAAGLRKLPVRSPDPALQKYVAGLSRRYAAQIAVIGLALGNKLVFAARHGVEVQEMDRYSTLCSRVIAEGDPLFVPDAMRSATFQGRDDVRAGSLRGYASAPLRLENGTIVGNIALMNPTSPLRMELDDVRSFRAAARELGPMLAERASEYA